MKSTDCLIIGGGPAGAAIAICLQQLGCKTILIERSGYGDWRVGETLPPSISVPLKTLGVWDSFLKQKPLPSQSILSAWGSPALSETHFLFNPYGNGWHIDRKRFDQMLANEAQAIGCELLPETRLLSLSRTNSDIWELALKNNEGTSISIEAKVLVDATGRSCSLARQLGSKRMYFDKLVGISRFFKPGSSKTKAQPYLLLEAGREGWWYSAPLPGKNLLITFMTDARLLPKLKEEQEKFWKSCFYQTTYTRHRAEDFLLNGEIQVSPAESSCLDLAGGSNWLAVGDAACSFDPLSGLGISKALQSGITAAKHIGDFLGGDRFAMRVYAEKAKSEFESYLETRSDYYKLETRWLAAPFWKKRREAGGLVSTGLSPVGVVASL